jgi:hypothetical protein
MDWSKQANEMIKTWTGTQQKVWETWMSSMQQLAAAPQSPEVWQKTVETWRGTVKQALESQVELTRLWAEGVAASAVNMPAAPSVPGLPAAVNPSTAMVEWTRQMLELTRSWTETQVRFSENWFDLLKKAEPAAMAQSWDAGQAQKIMATWQEAAQKAVDAQTEFSKLVMKATAAGSTANSKK